MEDSTWAVIVVVLGILGALGWYQLAKKNILFENIDGETAKKNLKLKDKYIEDLEKEIDGYRVEKEEYIEQANSWKGKYNQKYQVPKIRGKDYDLNENSDIAALAEDLLSKAPQFLPPEIAEFAKDPEIKKRIINYATTNPEAAKQFLGKFIGAKSEKSESQIIPGFDRSRAI